MGRCLTIVKQAHIQNMSMAFLLISLHLLDQALGIPEHNIEWRDPFGYERYFRQNWKR
ncbi:hypothetical protein [Xanthocytophaga agilis]|uniref:Uncharacterized protein n=1 Tax=Xanthocytophaga agilis TaxID=3048010 RepID=A0AAE3UJN1_9BACT|nr:hypothetical protein [Xanthocytophaga agilis]MDJ1505428.1 hypothetical protein [Xanthocytophaga agilis]